VGVLREEEMDKGHKELEWRDNMRFEVTRLVNMWLFTTIMLFFYHPFQISPC
jgi:hypothetical protein